MKFIAHERTAPVSETRMASVVMRRKARRIAVR